MKTKIQWVFTKFNFHLSRLYPRSFTRFGLKGEDLIGVEVGVFKGLNAKSMFKSRKVKRLYLVDPYKQYELGLPQKSLSNLKKKSFELLKDEDTRFIYYRFEEATKRIPNELDFVYIDASHIYEDVKRDINNYWRKIKVGGIMGGHDFYTNSRNEQEDEYGVVQAVTEFAVNNNLKLYIDNEDWWIFKEVKE